MHLNNVIRYYTVWYIMGSGLIMLSDIINNLNGESWELLCQKCYKIKYKYENYREIPANPNGDGGIEGFTSTGIVNQCYYPEGNYSDDVYYEYLRDKMTKDIRKLLDPKYKKKLIGFGVPVIKEWHFLIPKYRTNSILSHAKAKSDEVRKAKKDNRELYSHISDDFEIVVQDAENLQYEIYQVSIMEAWRGKIDLSPLVSEINWVECPSDKVANIKRKVIAICKSDDENDIQELVSIYSNAYIKGITLLTKLNESYKEMFEELQKLTNSYKDKLRIKTAFNPNSNENYTIFIGILEEFEKMLIDNFPSLNDCSRNEIVKDLIGAWLADCSLKFK